MTEEKVETGKFVDCRGDSPPKAEGQESATPSVNDVFQQQYAQFSAATSLASLADEYVYFTHGLLFTHGGWGKDPIIDHIAATNGDCAPFFIQTPLPVFTWFDAKARDGTIIDRQWNNQICVVKRDKWPSLFAFLAGIQGLNRTTKTLTRPIAQKVPIVDVFALSKMTVEPVNIPTVDCFAFALLSNRQTVYFAPELRKQTWQPIPVMIRRPDVKMVRFAKAILADQPKPGAGIIEPTLDQAKKAVKESPSRLDKITDSLLTAGKLDMTAEEACVHHGVDPKYLQQAEGEAVDSRIE